MSASPRESEALRPNPASVTSRILDLLAANPGALALNAGIDDWPAAHRNIGRFLSLHPAARDIRTDRDYQIRGCAAARVADPCMPRSCCDRGLHRRTGRGASGTIRVTHRSAARARGPL